MLAGCAVGVGAACPEEAARVWRGRCVDEAGGHGADVVVVCEEVEGEEEAGRGGEPWPGEVWEDDLDWDGRGRGSGRQGGAGERERRRGLTKGECAGGDEEDGKGDEVGPRCARDAVAETLEGLEAAEDDAGAGHAGSRREGAT